MNIYLDAYFDCNYGDDIFIKGITALFPMHRFYTILEHYPDRIIRWADEIPNLFLLPEKKLFMDKRFFDAYVCVGGDIFPDGGDFEKRKSYIRSVKANNGKVFFVGFSLFHEYGTKTKEDFQNMMKDADIIAPRDEESAAILRTILPDKEIVSMADLALSTEYFGESPKKERKNILGISVREPGNVSEEVLKNYILSINSAAAEYLKKDETNRVRLFGLSDGINSDRDIIAQITSEIEDGKRVEEVIYQGNIKDTVSLIEECELVIGTRFHAILTCIAKQIPFIPVSYEVKTDHLLKEISYDGTVYTFDDCAGLPDTVKEFTKGDLYGCDSESVRKYRDKSEPVLAGMKKLLDEVSGETVIKENPEGNEDVLELIYGADGATEVRRRKAEIDDLSAKNAECHRLIEEANEAQAAQFKEIEELNTKNAEYFALIEELNAKNAEFFKLIEDLNLQNAQLISQIEQLNIALEEEKMKNPAYRIKKKIESRSSKNE
ncbi:MAG: polysaccharide pyruvyl transferase family protein [Lachnospiraceae bacterium]|nr:polysaccharide pyruvyl transferase family protein [Lachnospiraceae bacterium]